MNRFKLHIILFFVASTLLINSLPLSAIDYEVDGYIYNLPMFTYVPDNRDADQLKQLGIEPGKMLWQDLTRLRIRPTLYLTDDTWITMHYEADALWAEIKNPMQDQVKISDISSRQALDLKWRPVAEDKFSLVHYIDMLYLKQMYDWGEIVLGRQRVSWGTGRVWQPTDLFAPLNPAEFSKFEKDGSDALSVRYYLGNFSDIEAVVNFRERLDQTNAGLRIRTNYKEYDMSVLGGWFDEKFVFGADFAGNLFDAGFRGEGIISVNPDNPDSTFTRWILGLDYQFNTELYALVEYQYNGQGTTCKNCYDMEALMAGRVLNVGKFYATGQLSYLIHPLVSIAVPIMSNIYDGSGYTGMTISYSMLDEVNIKAGVMYFFGAKGSEYSFYPSAGYFILEYYF